MTTNSHRTRYGPYNIIERYIDGKKVLDYVPASYGSEYNLSQSNRRIVQQDSYQSSDDDDEEEEYILTSHRGRYASARRPQRLNRIYYEHAPRSDIIEYVYQEDSRPRNEEIVEYVVSNRTPRRRYIEEIPSTHRSVNAHVSLPPIIRTPRINENLTPRRSILKQQTPRLTPMRITPRSVLSQNKNQTPHLPLSEVLAENRARRGSRIPKPRREVDEEELRDLPMYNKNFIKNGFLVHK